MIWATVAEVRDYLQDDDVIPTSTQDEAVQRMIDRVSRTLGSKVIRWPVLDSETDRASDEEQRKHIIAAIAETVKARYEAVALEQALGGAGNVEVIAGGGSITAGKLSVSGGSRSGSGAKIGKSADRVPIEAYEAMQDADLIGGSSPSW
ncbi:hypothetical protein Lesp02_70800 [Lentzea sp. NBRC 105346]|uniref:hypothetical protein n=1 Tax=Lentzea sp. NBRC 105346 TaxID=3032205 RepID=UPI0024A59054|nr:hypothetical protein [Lentzea sp. NBRC 105346]GLZ34893.1 hypothetical protein Lesp02_70800 [Lentzea sp. NBRC 105346]